MDFWSRLIGGSGPKTSRAKSTAERLTTFKKICNALHQIWRKTPRDEFDSPGLAAHIRACLDKLSGILRDEGRTPSPHPCHTYSASARIYLTATNLALLTDNPGVITSAGTLFNILIESEVDGIVDNRGFARALVDLVSHSATVGAEGEGRLVELLFGVANNIRSRPEILPAWFHPQKPVSQAASKSESTGDEEVTTIEKEERKFAGATRKDDFAFFYLLIDYVHHVGRSGDFARTGLLYIIETASQSKELEHWLVESDLATLMATGLGALYSQLNRKLTYPAKEDIPGVISHSDHAAVESARPPQMGGDMDAFLSYLLFWQDTIEHCKSVEVNNTLLDHFQVLFLQQLLYPSLLESSDVDGGSTSAVLTYLARILESLDQPDLVHRILHFLLASPTLEEIGIDVPPIVEESASRRKSVEILSTFADNADNASPELFNLVDICLMGVRSENMQTVVATLRLMTVIVDRHHIFASSFIKTLDERDGSEAQRCVGALNAEIQQFMSLATSVLSEPRLDNLYENYLADATAVLEVRNMELPLHNKDLLPEHYSKYPLQVDPNDELLEGIVDLLESFFTNSTVLNLALTDAISGLASSNLISLDGWLLVDPRYYQFPDPVIPEEDEEPSADGALDVNRAIAQLKKVYILPFWSIKHVPPITRVIRRLVKQVVQWRQEVPDFDILVAARKKSLQEDTKPVNTVKRQTIWSTELAFRGLKELKLDTTSLTTTDDSAVTESPATSCIEPKSSSSRYDTPAGVIVADDIRKRLNTPFIVKKPRRSTLSAGAARAKGLRSRVNTLRSMSSFNPAEILLSEQKPEEPVEQKADANEGTKEPGDNGKRETVDTAEDNSTLAVPLAPILPDPRTTTTSTLKEEEMAKEEQPVTLGYVLTNTILLYEFLLELSALIQMRASLFQEVSFIR
ncbi:hypothetical protein KEM54_006433 [Ascosphaera aggregata]|nr:hypothetical protein KEM54_006433 [Ascosphaera aggregata]